MKFKFNFLAACLAASGLLACTTGAFAASVEPVLDAEQVQHLSCVKQGDRLLCEVERTSDRASAPNQAAESLKSSTVTINLQMLTPQEQESLANILLWLTYIILGGACVGVVLYDKYCLHRATALTQKIQVLEKLWKQTSQN
ncbi:hypothetical protein H6F61_28675 [Cyanobacteria bacterium FACHB-472]|nr:hypothetical protein [Cyanobacteria bacterium FACHB-472]